MNTKKADSWISRKLRLVEQFSRVINQNPGQREAYYCRGRERGLLDDDAGALADLTKAIELAPDYAEAYVLRGLEKKIVADHKGAQADFSAAQELITRRCGARQKQAV